MAGTAEDRLTIRKVDRNTELAEQLRAFVESCSWEETREHIAGMIRSWEFTDWETMFAAVADGKIVGMASVLKTDYYPLPEVYPWVSCLFVSEGYRGRRISGRLIGYANRYLKRQGFDRSYIPTEYTGLYEHYGYRFLREIVNYGGGTDRLYVKDLDGMIYYRDEDLVIRDMEEADAQAFYDGFLAQGWHPEISVYRRRLEDRDEGKCAALAAVYRGQPAGFVYVYRTPHGGPFKGKDLPEIHDFNVLQKYQRRGIGSRLMDAAEQIAGQYADTVCLGVGLCDSYGSAQRMYVKRGYIPDGSGIWYQGSPCRQYETVCTVDDDLILYLSRKLPGAHPARDADRTGNPRRAAADEAETVAALACELWPDHSPEEMAGEFAELLSSDDAAVFVYRKKDEPVGFAQCQLRRDYVEGTETSPVGYLEGVFVKETARRQGIARELVSACVNWAREQGCAEFASDCELTNTESQAFHRAVGFEEANRLVAYVRKT